MLVSDAIAPAHPDAPSRIKCRRCAVSNEVHAQFEREMAALESARTSDISVCVNCGEFTELWDADGRGWCESCERFDQVYEEWMFIDE